MRNSAAHSEGIEMPDMNGLLDFVKTPAGQGLLAAAFGGLASARSDRGPLNTLGAAGLSGIAGYSAASSNALKQQKADMLQRQAQTIPTLYGKGADGGDTFDWKSAAALGLAPDEIAKFAQLPKAGMSKVARTIEVPGANGNKQTMQYDEYGLPVGRAIDSYVAPQLVDTGGSKQFAIPTAGQSFTMSMSPGEQAANSRGWAGIGLRGEQNDIMRQQVQATRELGLQEKSLKVDALRAAQAERQRALDGQRASVSSQIGVIDKALNHPGRETAVGLSGKVDPRNYVPGTDATNFQVLMDQIGGAAFLQAFESLKGGGQITEVEGKKATDAIARLNRNQSGPEFEQSLKDLREVMAAGQARLGGTASQQAPAAQPAAQPAGATIQRTGRDASGRKVIQYSDGRIEYGN
nr:hypothetical protein [uncultured Pseudomonas sp.]